MATGPQLGIARYSLPKGKDLCRVIDQHVAREEQRLSFRRLIWMLAWYYLNGSRRFDVFDPTSGALQAHYLDSEGNLEYQLTEMMNIVDRTTGRLKEISPWPRVMRTDHSLGGIRERAMMQVLLDSTVQPQQLEEAYDQFLHLYTLLGSCGVIGNVEEVPGVGITTDFEVIHPKELMPFPSVGADYTKVAGMLRQRVVPIDRLKEVFGRRIMDHFEEMDVFEAPIGATSGVDEDSTQEGSGGRMRWNFQEGASSGGPTKETTIDVVRLRQLWLNGSGGRCVRHVLCSGEYVIQDDDWSEMEYYCPVGFHQFIDTGTFHGAGLFDKLFSTVREFERLVKDVINNVREIDRYGVLVLPHGGFQHNTIFKEIGDTLKVAYYEPDVAGQDIRPFLVEPANASDIPGKVASLTKAILNDLSPIRDLAEEKGRVDSAAGLAALERSIQLPMTNATDGIRKAWGRMYRGLAGCVLQRVTMTEPRALPLNRLTLDLAGVVIDPETQMVSFENNPLPTTSRMEFSIRGREVQGDAAKIQGAIELTSQKLQDPIGMRLYFLQEGLEVPMWLEEEKSAYESVIENILTIFGDGMIPGEVVFTPNTVRPEFQLRVLGAFMQSPVMKKASPEVIDRLQDYREALLMMMQPILPPGVPEAQDLGLVRSQLPPGQSQQGPPQSQRMMSNVGRS